MERDFSGGPISVIQAACGRRACTSPWTPSGAWWRWCLLLTCSRSSARKNSTSQCTDSRHRYTVRGISGEFSVILFNQYSFIVLISENVLKDYEIIILEYQSIIHMFNHTVHVSSSRGLLCYNTVNSFCCFTATGLPFDSGLYRGHSLCTLCLWTTPVSRLSGQPV